VSGHVVSDVKKHSTARGNDRLVLIEIADQANHDGWAVLRVGTIAENTLVAPRTVHDCLNRLEAADELERRSGKEAGRSNVFRVLIGARAKGEPVPVELVEKFDLPTTLTSAEPAHPPTNPDEVPGSAASAEGGYAEPADQGYAATRRGGMQPAADIRDSSPPSSPKTDSSLRSESAATPRDEVRRHVLMTPEHLRATMATRGWMESDSTAWLFLRYGQRRDWLFEAAGEVVGISPAELTKNGRGRVNGALKQLRDVGADPLEVIRRGRRFVQGRGRRPSIFELATVWAELGEAADDRFSRGDSRLAEAAERAARAVS